MSSETPQGAVAAFETLRQLARRRASTVERCELCSAAVFTEHPHLVDPKQRRLVCACDACALLFSAGGNGRFKLVPRDVRRLAGFQMTDAEWDGLLIPINLAFFIRGSDNRVSAFYPSPAGATESLLPLETWNSIVFSNPALNELQPNVEALLVNRVGHAREAAAAEYYIAPIDACYRLVGLIRLHWHGLSGGEVVWHEIAGFFAELRSRAQVITEEAHA
jgi:hypothetical protein